MNSKLTYRELLVELRFIGCIPENKIVDVINHRFQERNTWSTTITRELTARQSRQDTVEWLQSVSNQAQTFLQNLKEYEQQTLLEVLEKSLTGINNLAKTYEEDDVYVSCKMMATHDEIKDIIAVNNRSSSRVSTPNTGRGNNSSTGSTANEDNYFDE